MTTTQTLAERVEEAMAAFPNLSEQEIAAILLAPPAIQTVQNVAAAAIPDVTIAEIIRVLRDEYMAVELARPRAILEADGTMKQRNTSTYRTYNTYWKRLEEKYGAMLVRDVTQKLVLEFCAEGAASAVEKHQVSDVNR